MYEDDLNNGRDSLKDAGLIPQDVLRWWTEGMNRTLQNIAGSPLCSSHDDDDGRGRPVQDEMEASMEESHKWGPRQEDQGPHG